MCFIGWRLNNYYNLILRILFITLVTALSSCSNDDTTSGRFAIENEAGKGAFTLPPAITALEIDVGAISATLTIDDGSNPPRFESMTINGNQAEATVTGIAPGTYTVTISFYYTFFYEPQGEDVQIMLVDGVIPGVQVQTGQNTNVQFDIASYFYHDLDEDGIFNIVEIDRGTDPYNSSSIPLATCSQADGVIDCNFAPVASLVSVSGVAQVGNELTGQYTYNDEESDPEGSSTFRWLRDGVEIPGATGLSYTLVDADSSANIQFEVRPVATSGFTIGAPVLSGSVVVNNNAPVASSVSIVDDNGGVALVGELLIGNYTYSDRENDAEGTSLFRWLRNGTAISGATALNYTVVAADSGANLVFEVTPVASTGTTNGEAVVSNPINISNSPPVVSSVMITDTNGGSTVVGDTLTGSYDYFDIEGDNEGGSIYRWLRNGAAINGATSINYTVVAADVGGNLSFEVTPVASTGGSPGAPDTSGSISVVNSAPVFSSAGSVSVSENTTNIGYSAVATDPEGNTVTYLLSGGTDRIRFSLNSSTGALSFVNSPDYEFPADVDKNNVYNVDIKAIDGSGGESVLSVTVTVTDVSNLVAEVTFPPSNANLGGQVVQTTFAGKLIDLEDGIVEADDVALMNIDGNQVTVVPGSPGRWSVKVPVAIPSDTHTITVQSDTGVQSIFDYSTTNSPVLSNMPGVVIDSANNRALVVDDNMDALIAVNLSNGVRTVISNVDFGSGPLFTSPSDMVLDSTNNRVLITDYQINGLFSVNLTTGDRARIDNSGPFLSQPFALVLDSINNRVLVSDGLGGLQSIVAIDLASGIRSIVSSATIGTGPAFSNPKGIELDLANNRALVVDDNLNALLAVDLSSGNRSVVSDNSTGTGPTFNTPGRLALDLPNNRAIIIDNWDTEIFIVDLGSGNRTIRSDAFTGSGPKMQSPIELAYDSANNRVLVSDGPLHALLWVELTAGNRTIMSESRTGSGVAVVAAEDMRLDKNNGVIWVTRWYGVEAKIMKVDIATGNRTVVSDRAVGSGPFIDQVTRIDFRNGNTLLGLDRGITKALFEIDMSTGNRTILSSNTLGTGILFEQPWALAYNPITDRAYVANDDNAGQTDEIIEIDLSTGNRTILSDVNNGSGPTFSSPESLTMDLAHNRLLLVDRGVDGVTAIDLVTGNRTILSNASIGSGPNLSWPVGIIFNDALNRAFVTDWSLSAVFEINLDNGNRTIVSDEFIGTGIFLQNPRGPGIDEDNSLVYTADRSLGAVIVIDLDSGDRAILSM